MRVCGKYLLVRNLRIDEKTTLNMAREELGLAKWGISSPGRASALHAEGNRFESDMLHSSKIARVPKSSN